MEKTVQPKILRKALTRIALGMFAIAVLILIYQKAKQVGVDPTGFFGGGDSVGHIAAIQETEDGSQVVLIKPDGMIQPSPGFTPESFDRDPAWPADGRFLYFVSDRENRESHVFRWDIGGNKVERKSLDKRTKGATWFPPGTFPGASETGLVISGGNVVQFSPKTGETRQLLPPVSKDIGGGDEGAKTQFDALYGRLGVSFKEAKWGKDKAWIAAIMRRESGSEILIVQDAEAKDVPITVVAGQHIDFDVSPTENKLVYTVTNFEFPDQDAIPKEYIKNGKITRPFSHGVGIFDLSNPADPGAIGLSADDKIAFTSPKISPDGTTLLLLVGGLGPNGAVKPVSLASLPVVAGGFNTASRIIDGEVMDPSWGAEGQVILFTKIVNKHRAIFSINRDGSNEKNLTGDKGDFSSPQMSPARKKE